MRVEHHHGHYILCGCIIDHRKIEVGSVWQAVGGHKVTVTDVDQFAWVRYTWEEKGETRFHEKESFAFQCRYCLVLKDANIPDHLKESDS